MAVGVAAATVAATVGGTWGAWWAPRISGTRTGPSPTDETGTRTPRTDVRLEMRHATVTVHGASPAASVRLPVRMGDLPREPVGFQPREDLVAELARVAEENGLTVVHAVTGARGVGKTQLAAAYARRRIEEGWPVVAWITAESSGRLTSGLAELAEQLGVREAGDDTVSGAQAALIWIVRNPDPCLLVLDNATDPDEVARWLPTAGRAQVVVTTTAQAFENIAGSGRLSYTSISARRRLGAAYASLGLGWRHAVLQKRLLDELTEKFGPDHPDVLWQRDWWSHALRCAGRWRKALQVARDRVADCERLYGPDHLWTFDARRLVAVTARRTGRVRMALAECSRLTDDLPRVHGPDHPLTLMARGHLAYATLWSLRPHRATALCDTLLDDSARVFGPDSVQVKRLARRQALLCLLTGHPRRLRTALRMSARSR
ncbi:hypothetical protein AB0A91_06600 [Streptomyces sp. NPDC042207]|uniref:hypothetical protein n=1 Tax=Streptomyces sp. NPDC042207 TaxID=3154331 RepID=UPI0033D362CE